MSEREKKLLDGLRMMGLSPLVSTMAWWLLYTLIFSVGVSAVTIITAVAQLFPGANLVLFWITLELFMVSMLAAGFVVSSVMATAKPSQGAATLMYMAGFGLFAVNLACGRPALLEHLLCLICFVAGPVGVLNFLDGAVAGAPLTLSNLADGQTPLLAVWAYLLFDAGVCVLLAWYLEQVRFGGERTACKCSPRRLPFPTGALRRRALRLCVSALVLGNDRHCSSRIGSDGAAGGAGAEHPHRGPCCDRHHCP